MAVFLFLAFALHSRRILFAASPAARLADQADLLRRELDTRFLASHDRSMAIPPPPYMRQEAAHHHIHPSGSPFGSLQPSMSMSSPLGPHSASHLSVRSARLEDSPRSLLRRTLRAI